MTYVKKLYAEVKEILRQVWTESFWDVWIDIVFDKVIIG